MVEIRFAVLLDVRDHLAPELLRHVDHEVDRLERVTCDCAYLGARFPFEHYQEVFLAHGERSAGVTGTTAAAVQRAVRVVDRLNSLEPTLGGEHGHLQTSVFGNQRAEIIA